MNNRVRAVPITLCVAHMRAFGLSADELAKGFTAFGKAVRQVLKVEALQKIRYQPFFR